MMFRAVCNRVINPDKVKDIAFIICKFVLAGNRSGNKPVVVFIGGGTKDAYYNQIKLRREIEITIEYFKIRNISLRNIICVDADHNICSTWKKTGITVIRANWFATQIYRNIRRTIQEIAFDGGFVPRILLYANTFGRGKDCEVYERMIATIKPHRFIGLYSTRPNGFTDKLKKFKDYKISDLGTLANSKTHNIKGCVIYRGIAMCVFDRIVRR